jgi:hypothetical protein
MFNVQKLHRLKKKKSTTPFQKYLFFFPSRENTHAVSMEAFACLGLQRVNQHNFNSGSLRVLVKKPCSKSIFSIYLHLNTPLKNKYLDTQYFTMSNSVQWDMLQQTSTIVSFKKNSNTMNVA